MFCIDGNVFPKGMMRFVTKDTKVDKTEKDYFLTLKKSRKRHIVPKV